jgi:hypothetical protein
VKETTMPDRRRTPDDPDRIPIPADVWPHLRRLLRSQHTEPYLTRQELELFFPLATAEVAAVARAWRPQQSAWREARWRKRVAPYGLEIDGDELAAAASAARILGDASIRRGHALVTALASMKDPFPDVQGLRDGPLAAFAERATEVQEAFLALRADAEYARTVLPPPPPLPRSLWEPRARAAAHVRMVFMLHTPGRRPPPWEIVAGVLWFWGWDIDPKKDCATLRADHAKWWRSVGPRTFRVVRGRRN